jgi:hypothetical protein
MRTRLADLKTAMTSGLPASVKNRKNKKVLLDTKQNVFFYKNRLYYYVFSKNTYFVFFEARSRPAGRIQTSCEEYSGVFFVKPA